jgi:hypothetical protein
MTDINIIRMAKEASGDDWGIFKDFMPEIERFAELVAAAEREACAKVCDGWPDYNVQGLAEAIRARGQK